MKLRHVLMGALGAALIGGAAQAAGTYSYTFTTPSTYTVPVGQQLVIDFDTMGSSANYALSGFVTTSGSSGNLYAAPSSGGTVDSSKFGYVSAVPNTSPGTLTLASGVSSLSFLYGSPDSYNQISFFDANGSQVGSTINGNTISSSGAGGVVNFSFTAPVTKVSFATSQNSLEIDDIAVGSVSAAPEPGMWALMLAGVAALGFALRRGRQHTLVGLSA